MNPVEKIVEILKEHWFMETESLVGDEECTFYTDAFANAMVRTWEHPVEFELATLNYRNTIVSFGPDMWHYAYKETAFFMIRECYNKRGDMVHFTWNYISNDDRLDSLLWEMDRRIYKLYNEGE